MYRTFVILRHTFLEAIVQPIFTLLLALGAVILFIFALLPIVTLFATSRSIYEEIEDRTMLTLMSKPVQKWEVLVGKYLGIALAALLAIAVLGAILILCTWARLPGDYQLKTTTVDEREL